MSPLGVWSVGERVPTQGPDQREAVTTQGAVEPALPRDDIEGAAERPWESLPLAVDVWRFDRRHDLFGLNGWPEPGDLL
jgi:hypothetical protein